MTEYNRVTLVPPSTKDFTDEEIVQLGYLIDQPLMRKFLNARMYNSLVDYANLPLESMTDEKIKGKANYIQGSLNLVYDMLRMADNFMQQRQENKNLKGS